MTMCLCFIWYFPNDSAFKFDVMSILFVWGVGGVEGVGGDLGFLVSSGYVD